MKEIWNTFVEACKQGWNTFYEGLKSCLKSTFVLFKDTCVAFVTGIFAWLKELGIGLGKILWALIEVVIAAFVAMVKAIFELVFNKLIAWIKKW